MPHSHLSWAERPVARSSAVSAASITIEFLGNPASHKGWPVFERRAAALRSDKSVRFVVLGVKKPADPKMKWARVNTATVNPTAMAGAVAAEKLDIVLHWPSCPETFSLAVHEVIEGGAFVVTNDASGNLAKIVEETGCGTILKNEAALLALFKNGAAAHLAQVARSRRRAATVSRQISEMTVPLLFGRSNMAVHAFTSFSYSYLDRARVFAASLRRRHPDWVIWAVLTDKEPEGCQLDWSREEYDRVVTAETLFGEKTSQWLFDHDIVEACTAVKGSALQYIMDDETAEKIFYFDPDIAVFNSVNHVVDLLDCHSIALTPYQIDPEPSGDTIVILDNEVASLSYGIFNLGFIAVRNDAEARRFADWWTERLRDRCHDRLDISASSSTRNGAISFRASSTM